MKQCRAIILLTLLFFVIAVFLQSSSVKGPSVQTALEDTHNCTFPQDFGNVSLKEHKITSIELTKLKSNIGVCKEGTNYNQIVDGKGTGLRPPTASEWNGISQSVYLIDNVSYSNTPFSIDNSKSQYFPPIGNQGTQGSCTTWAIGYYTKTFQEAREHGWNLTGGPTDEIMSPSFIYNLINGGTDGGSSFYGAINLLCGIGESTLSKMPYNQNDYTTWPSELAWQEATQYRSNVTTYNIMDLQSDSGLQNLKNWLASGSLAVIGVDAYQIYDQTLGYSLLTSQDMLTLDNYNNPSINHAVTVIGYDDNMSYTEQGQTHYGAFKIANSWGISSLPSPFSWEHILDGCFYISYAAMEQQVKNCYVCSDIINYKPELTATFNLSDDVRNNCQITVGLGTPNKPIVTKSLNNYISGGSQPFCTNNVIMDITEFKNYVPSFYNQSFFLKVNNNQGPPYNATIRYFAIGNWSASGTPCPTIKNQNVYLNITYNPYVTTNITLLPAGGSAPVSANNYFAIPYYLNGQPQIANCISGSLMLVTDGGTNITISGISSGSNATEQWLLNSKMTPATISAGSNATFYYYDLLSQQTAYTVTGSENLIKPSLSYWTAPSTPSLQLNPNAASIWLSNSNQTIMALRATTVTISNNIPYIVPPALTPQAQWTTQISSWNINQTNQIPNPITYYFQYQFNATYATSDTSTTPSTPLISATQLGTNYQLPLSTTNQTTWLDANTTWSINSTIMSQSGTEQWTCPTGTLGNITGPTSINAIYVHQYYLAVNSPYGSPSGTGWYDAGQTANITLPTSISAASGTQYVLNSWIGSGAGSYNGSAGSYSVIMSSPITETADWITQYYLTVDNGGCGSISGSGWYNDGTNAQTAILSNIVPGGVGTQYVFTGWTGDASGLNLTSNSIIMDSPKTATATWATQYQLTFALTPSASASTSPTGANLWVIPGPLSISVTPNSGYTFSGWTTDNNSITFDNSAATFTTANINGPGTITASLTLTPSPTPQPTPTPTATPRQQSSSTSSSSPTPTESASPTPNVPEFSSLVILSALITIMLLTAVMLTLRRHHLKHQTQI